ncbi:MAG: hypothetical protein SCARUB_00068 [Candidatus Scalindua rubra]|uniref:Cytochrome C n=1 Tax=Candidatus Scalindua rubra TaxID=1872076 RepID=A0A1E3XGR6_9BACT|nr:MAG: hypothetical protein SCARUB_00068 [Candidatus Scalindua rubra]
MKKRIFLIGFSVFVIFGMLMSTLPRESQAIPPFARKYQTACTTCHWATFPKLNAFGRAFRASGLRIPFGNDEVFVRDKPVSLGADIWSSLFPKALWPSDMPGLPPVGLAFKSEFNMTRERNRNPMGVGATRRDNFPGNFFSGIGSVELFSGGTLGETLSWFGVVGIFDNEGFGGSTTDIDRAYFNWAPFIFGEQGYVNVRFGQFEPRAVPVSNHRRQIRLTPYLMDIFPVLPAGNFFGFAPTQKGIEIWGSLNGFGGKGGLEWAAGIVNGQPGGALGAFDGASGVAGTIRDNVNTRNNGRFDVNSGKDWYVTASYKIGGMGVLGEEGVAEKLELTENWQDNSIRIKGYYYQGTTGAFTDTIGGGIGNAAFLGGATNDNWDEDANQFKRFGVVLDANWWNFNIIGAASYMEDDLKGTTTFNAMGNMPLETGDKFDVEIYTTEVQYVANPWLVPSFRFEKINPDYDVRDLNTFERYSFDVAILARANIKFLAGATFSSLPDARTGTNGLDMANPDLPPFDDMWRIGVDIDF